MTRQTDLPNPTPVVSVRLDRALVDKLDQLVRHTGRSRGFYIRAALEAQLPALVEHYWAHEVTAATTAEDEAFRRLMLDAMPDVNDESQSSADE